MQIEVGIVGVRVAAVGVPAIGRHVKGHRLVAPPPFPGEGGERLDGPLRPVVRSHLAVAEVEYGRVRLDVEPLLQGPALRAVDLDDVHFAFELLH